MAKGGEVKKWVDDQELSAGDAECPGSALRGGGTGRVGCSQSENTTQELCPACRKAQSKALIKAAVRSRSVLGGKWRSLQSIAVCV